MTWIIGLDLQKEKLTDFHDLIRTSPCKIMRQNMMGFLARGRAENYILDTDIIIRSGKAASFPMKATNESQSVISRVDNLNLDLNIDTFAKISQFGVDGCMNQIKGIQK